MIPPSQRSERNQSFIVCYYHVTYVFPSECTLYSCLIVKELLAGNRWDIWSLSDNNWIRMHNHLVRIRTLNNLAELVKWSSCVVSSYLYGAFDCMLSTDKYLQHSSIIWPVWLKVWVFVYDLSDCGFESHCCHLSFRYRICLSKEFLDI